MDLNRSLIYHGGKQVKQISFGANNKLYEWKIDDVALGPPVTIPPETIVKYDGSITRWETFITPGKSGSKLLQAKSNWVNGNPVGATFDNFETIITHPVKAIRTVGVRHIENTLKKSETVKILGYPATTEHPLKRRIAFPDYKWPINTKAFITFRVSNGGLNNSNVTGRVRFKHQGTNMVSTMNFTAVVDTTDVDNPGNPLCVVIASMDSSATTHFADYIDLFFDQPISNIYDANVYFDKGELLQIRVTGNPTVYRTTGSGTSALEYYYYPFTQAIDKNKEYLIKTMAPPLQRVQVGLTRKSTSYRPSLGYLEIGDTEGLTVSGSKLNDTYYKDGLSTQYSSKAGIVPGPNLYLIAYELNK